MSRELVFVRLYVMLGDADGSIHGFAVTEKNIWERQKIILKKFLEEMTNSSYIDQNGSNTIELDDPAGYGHLSLKSYKEQECSEEELKTLQKFCNNGYDKHVLCSSGDFRWPTEVIDWELHQEFDWKSE